MTYALAVAVVVLASVLTVLWVRHGDAVRRIARLENYLAQRGEIEQFGPVVRRVTLEKSDWCGKRKAFVVTVRIDDKGGTRRVNGLVNSLDDITIARLVDEA